MRQTHTDSAAEQDLINVTAWFNQLVPREFRRRSITLNPIDRTFPLPTYSHSYQRSISIGFTGANFLHYFLLHQVSSSTGEGAEERKTKCQLLSQLALDSYNLHGPPFIPHNAGEISSLLSKAASSFRLIIRVGRNLRARVQLFGTVALVNKERESFSKGTGGKGKFTRNP